MSDAMPPFVVVAFVETTLPVPLPYLKIEKLWYAWRIKNI